MSDRVSYSPSSALATSSSSSSALVTKVRYSTLLDRSSWTPMATGSSSVQKRLTSHRDSAVNSHGSTSHVLPRLAEEPENDEGSPSQQHQGQELRDEPDDYPRDRVDHVLHFLSSRATPVLPLPCFHPNVRPASAAKVRTKKLQAMRGEFTLASSPTPIAKDDCPASIPSPRRKAKRGRPRHREGQGNVCGSLAQSSREGRASHAVSLGAERDTVAIGRGPVPSSEIARGSCEDDYRRVSTTTAKRSPGSDRVLLWDIVQYCPRKPAPFRRRGAIGRYPLPRCEMPSGPSANRY